MKTRFLTRLLDDRLDAIGLQRRRSPLATAALIGGGAVVGVMLGAALGALFAPNAGAETRRKLMHGLGKLDPGALAGAIKAHQPRGVDGAQSTPSRMPVVGA